jgi:hypothetical protein
VSAEVGSRPPWEVFYACPTATAPAFLEATQELAQLAAATDGAAGDGVEAAPHPAAERLAALAVLARAMQVRDSTGSCLPRMVLVVRQGRIQNRAEWLSGKMPFASGLANCCCWESTCSSPACFSI